MVQFQPGSTRPPTYDPTSMLAQGAAVSAFASTVSNEIEKARQRAERQQAASILAGVDPEAAAFMAAGGDPGVVLEAQRLGSTRESNRIEEEKFRAKQTEAQRLQLARQAFMQQAPSYFGEGKMDVAGAFGLAGSLGLSESDVTGTITGLREGVESQGRQKHFAEEQANEAEKKKAADEYYNLIANESKANIQTMEAPMGELVTRAYDEAQLSPEQLATLKAMRAEKVKLRYVPGGFMGKLTELATKGGVPAEAQKKLREQYLGSDVIASEDDFNAYVEKNLGSRFDKALPPVTNARAPKEDKSPDDLASIQQRAQKTAQNDPRYLGKQLAEMQALGAADPSKVSPQTVKFIQLNNLQIEHEALMRELDASKQGALKPQVGLASAMKAKELGADKKTFFAMLRLAGIDPDAPAGGAAPQRDRIGSLPGVGGKDD